MLISDHVCASINEQIGNEFGAMMQYLAIAAHFDRETLPMLSGHFFKQAEEEKEHAYKFIKYLLDAGGRVAIPTIPAPQATLQFAEDAVKLSLEGEKEVTRQINNLVGMAKAESDYTTDTFLQWFVNEQLEEVSSMDMLLKMVQRTGESGLMLVESALASGRGLSLNSPEE